MKKSHRTIDPTKLSASVRALNPHIVAPATYVHVTNIRRVTGVRIDKPDELKMNKTERRYLALLERRKKFGSISGFQAWPLTLRWGGNMHYTPDFGVTWNLKNKMSLIEVKGPHIRSRDIVRFKGCRAEWSDIFTFEMWQLVDGAWTQLL